jgi:hypothetical protein
MAMVASHFASTFEIYNAFFGKMEIDNEQKKKNQDYKKKGI